MKCIDCRFFKQSEEINWSGVCTISLPPHMHEAANNFGSMTRDDSGCDLGQAKQQAAEEE